VSVTSDDEVRQGNSGKNEEVSSISYMYWISGYVVNHTAHATGKSVDSGISTQ
jgi:hypothetical protein